MPTPWLKVVTVPVAVLTVYFVVPVAPGRAPLGVPGGIAVSAVLLAGVAKLVFDEARGARQRLTALQLALALEITLVVFAFSYYLVASHDPDAFVSLSTRLDAVYFSVATAATVGFGDVHAQSQVARALVTGQMVFNIIFVAAVVNLVRERMSRQRSARGETAGGRTAPSPDHDA